MFHLAGRHYIFSGLLLFCCSNAGLAGVVIESELSHEQSAAAGETYRGRILLRNTDASPSEAKVYQTDYDFSADEGIVYGTPGNLDRSNAKWISLSRGVVVIPGHGTETLDFEVKVPAGGNNALSGTYWSMIMMEPISKSSSESGEEASQATAQVRQVIRYGIQVVTHIGNTGAGALSFENPQISTEGDSRLFTIDVANTGQRWVRPGLWLELYSDTGDPIGKFQGPATRLYPGTSSRMRIDLGNTAPGNYLGLVVADGTGDNLFGANVELEIK